jgi:hypothetical protein
MKQRHRRRILGRLLHDQGDSYLGPYLPNGYSEEMLLTDLQRLMDEAKGMSMIAAMNHINDGLQFLET